MKQIMLKCFNSSTRKKNQIILKNEKILKYFWLKKIISLYP